MADLSFMVDDSTVGYVDEYVAVEAAKKPPRRYLGMSEIGGECTRALWLKCHTDFKETFSGSQYRLFDTGHLIERRVVRNLRAAGLEVTQRQKSFSVFRGRLRGHWDGLITGLRESTRPHVLEIKSASEKNFKILKDAGIESSPRYLAQVQMYMGCSGLDRALFIVENKNTSERIQERIRFDRDRFDMLREKARLIIEAQTPPSGINDNPAWWQCKICPLNNEQWCRKEWKSKDTW